MPGSNSTNPNADFPLLIGRQFLLQSRSAHVAGSLWRIGDFSLIWTASW
jgi:hypothetical protein